MVGVLSFFVGCLSLRKKFESLFGDKLEVMKQHQQQENLKFLSHFKRKFVVRIGKRPLPPSISPLWRTEQSNASAEFFQLRTNGSPIALRCIQVGDGLVCCLMTLYFQRCSC